MKSKWIIIGGVAAVAGAAMFVSRERREEVLNRIDGAARVLNGTEEGSTPKIVAEQQRKERARQNSTWTPENQVAHPIEYCQAQIEEVGKLSKQLDVQLHRLSMTKSATQRQIDDNKAQSAAVSRFLSMAKSAYRLADASNTWPIVVNGYKLSKNLAKERIIDAANKLPILEKNISTASSNLSRIEAKIDANASEQRKLVDIRERLQSAIADIKTKRVIDGEKGIADALNAINDSVLSLNPNVGEPTLDELVVPDKIDVRDAAFESIMQEP